MASPFLDRLDRGPILADGAMGTLLYARGIPFDHCFDEVNLSDPERISAIHRDYLAAGAELIETNTFGANRIRLGHHGLEDKVHEITRRAVRVARDAREVSGLPAYVAGSIGPLGKPLAPYGSITEDEAQGYFREAVDGLLEGGVDVFFLETFSDLREVRAALRAARAACNLPVVAEMSFAEDLNTLFGHSPEEVVAALLDEGSDLVGINCSVGPQGALDVLERMHEARPNARLSVLPNAGLPQMLGGRYLYVATPEYFAGYLPRYLKRGALVVGGCCGTTPEHTRALAERMKQIADAGTAASKGDAGGNASAVVIRGSDGTARPRASVAVEEEPPPTDREGEPRLLRLIRQKFVISVELDPPRGINPKKILAGARLIHEAGVDAVNIADSPMARVRMGAQSLAWLVLAHFPMEVILHFTTRDRNLMGIQADLLGAHAVGLRNILCLTGDPPSLGDYPNVTAVYDVDSIGLVHIVSRLNQGTDLSGNPVGGQTRFAIACAVNPTADDLDLEVERFRKKLDAGAQVAMTQPFYDWSVWERFVEIAGEPPIPVLMGILPLQSHRHAEFLHNEVPGILVPQWMRDRLAKAGAEGQDEGVAQARELFQEAKRRRDTFAGVYLMPSFGRYENCLEVLKS